MESIYGEQVSGLADTAVFSLHTESRGIVDDVSQSVFNLKNTSLTANIIEEARHSCLPGRMVRYYCGIFGSSTRLRIHTYSRN
jgi:hypothetical protein